MTSAVTSSKKVILKINMMQPRSAAATSTAIRSHRAPPPPPPPINPSGIFYAAASASATVSYQLPLPVAWENAGKSALGLEKARRPPRERIQGHISERPYGSMPVDKQMRLSIAEGIEPQLQSANRQNNRLRERTATLERHNRSLRLALSRMASVQGTGVSEAGLPSMFAAARDDPEYAAMLASFLQTTTISGPQQAAPPVRPHTAEQKAALHVAYAPKRKPPSKPPPLHIAAAPHRAAPTMKRGDQPPPAARPSSVSMVVVPASLVGMPAAGCGGASEEQAARARLETEVAQLKRRVAELSTQLEHARAAGAAGAAAGAEAEAVDEGGAWRHEVAVMASLRGELEEVQRRAAFDRARAEAAEAEVVKAHAAAREAESHLAARGLDHGLDAAQAVAEPG